eukprot:gnl/Trimastix_PCT/529.p2 GENE.gnl/Trimastix_PCT/529~~gnl/Trimastix_PCT/529.p2  ORF type:complete len:218 (+),score=54.59 gnl/Trimastix_PCT/529:71-724(+)
MPKSKRSQPVVLAETVKKNRAQKEYYVNSLRDALDKYNSMYVFQYENMKTQLFQDVRNAFTGSKFFLGKNKLMMVALGRTPESEYKDGVSRIAARVHGSAGLLLTDEPREKVVEFFRTFTRQGYATAGCVADRAFALPAGTLPNTPASVEPYLRGLGLPTEVKNGDVNLLTDYVVCESGQQLGPLQCRILKHFNIPMATFSMTLHAVWTADGGYEEL